MVTLIGFNKKISHLIEHYIKHINLRLPTVFNVGSVSSARAKRKKGQVLTKVSKRKKSSVYHLYGDGAFGGLVLHGYLILKNQEELFDEIQAAHLHSADVILPERLADMTKVVRTKKFRSQGRVQKKELNTNT